MSYPMPEIATKIETLITEGKITGEFVEIARALVGRGGLLRSSKPSNGDAAYVWRMVAFSVSRNPKHHCMPMTADFDLPVWDESRKAGEDTHTRMEKVRARTKELDAVLTNPITNMFKLSEQPGVTRWARAFGYL